MNRVRTFAAAGVIAMLASAHVARADLAKGLAAYKAGDFKTAQREFRESAEAGEPAAMLSLAFLYMHGEGVAADDKEAAHWLTLAAERGLAPAQHSLALAYYEGRGVERNTAVAANYFESAALQGLADAQFNLGVLYSRGDGVPQDWRRARFWHEKAAEQGVVDSEIALGLMYANGQGVPVDYVEAARWYGKAAAAGSARARRALELFGETPAIPAASSQAAAAPGRELSADRAASTPRKPAPPAPRNFWRKAPSELSTPEFQSLQTQAVTGDAAAQLQLALHYYHGVSTKRNLVRAYVWAKRSADKGNREGIAMAKGMYWELDEQQKGIAKGLLAPRNQ
ncbi:MAG: SEL1-like repeat protein [Bryobacterales bacterium]|nr:SEL1-like repeat protein [Bryobacterales bacterium]